LGRFSGLVQTRRTGAAGPEDRKRLAKSRMARLTTTGSLACGRCPAPSRSSSSPPGTTAAARSPLSHGWQRSSRPWMDSTGQVTLAITTRSVNAVLAEAPTIPVVFTLVTDPVGQRLVESMARPGRDVTGFTPHEQSVGSKWVQILKEIAPQTKHTTVMLNPDVAPYYRMYMSSMEFAASSLEVEISEAHVRSRVEVEAAISTIANQPASALIVMSDPFLGIHRDLIIALTAKYLVPAIYPYRLFVPEGGLISYGVDIVDIHRRAANYVDRILKGESAADLPVQTPSKYELDINLKTAKALGLSVPPTLLATADEVIE